MYTSLNQTYILIDFCSVQFSSILLIEMFITQYNSDMIILCVDYN